MMRLAEKQLITLELVVIHTCLFLYSLSIWTLKLHLTPHLTQVPFRYEFMQRLTSWSRDGQLHCEREVKAVSFQYKKTL